jgi:hypothetical protein
LTWTAEEDTAWMNYYLWIKHDAATSLDAFFTRTIPFLQIDIFFLKKRMKALHLLNTIDSGCLFLVMCFSRLMLQTVISQQTLPACGQATKTLVT